MCVPPSANGAIARPARDPLSAFRESGYLEKITAERGAKNAAAVTSYA